MDHLSIIRRPVETELTCYKRYFDEALSHEDDFMGRVLAHVRSRSGKMMRPLLVLLVAKESGSVNEAALRSAVTLELLHTASLVHDDVVDESDERRGLSSVNAVFGNKVAVLMGDYLLSTALCQAAMTADLRCVDIVARLGGTLSEGEVYQLSNIRSEVSSEAAYFSIIRSKTAALFAACARLGALVSGADDAFVREAAAFGENVGICFQIRDDIFDYFDDGNIGKPTGNDMAEGKLTLPALYVLRVSEDPALHAAAGRIKQGRAAQADIDLLVSAAKTAGGIDYARGVMEEYREKALRNLDAFTRPDIREALAAYLDFAIGRKI